MASVVVSYSEFNASESIAMQHSHLECNCSRLTSYGSHWVYIYKMHNCKYLDGKLSSDRT